MLIILLLFSVVMLFLRYSKTDFNYNHPNIPDDYKKPNKPVLKPIKRAKIAEQKKVELQNPIITVPKAASISPQIPFIGYKNDVVYKLRNKTNGFEVNFHDYYYPNRIGIFTEDQLNFRNFVYNFKDGRTSEETAKFVASGILSYYGQLIQDNRSNIVFCPIPASSRLKNILRFERFCKIVSTDLKITNGFNFIEITNDRQPNKGNKIASRTSNLSYKNSLFKDKIVFLFDDIYTFGNSFKENAKALEAAGAKKIIGVFLGKTYYNG